MANISDSQITCCSVAEQLLSATKLPKQIRRSERLIQKTNKTVDEERTTLFVGNNLQHKQLQCSQPNKIRSWNTLEDFVMDPNLEKNRLQFSLAWYTDAALDMLNFKHHRENSTSVTVTKQTKATNKQQKSKHNDEIYLKADKDLAKYFYTSMPKIDYLSKTNEQVPEQHIEQPKLGQKNYEIIEIDKGTTLLKRKDSGRRRATIIDDLSKSNVQKSNEKHIDQSKLSKEIFEINEIDKGTTLLKRKHSNRRRATIIDDFSKSNEQAQEQHTEQPIDHPKLSKKNDKITKIDKGTTSLERNHSRGRRSTIIDDLSKSNEQAQEQHTEQLIDQSKLSQKNDEITEIDRGTTSLKRKHFRERRATTIDANKVQLKKSPRNNMKFNKKMKIMTNQTNTEQKVVPDTHGSATSIYNVENTSANLRLSRKKSLPTTEELIAKFLQLAELPDSDIVIDKNECLSNASPSLLNLQKKDLRPSYYYDNAPSSILPNVYPAHFINQMPPQTLTNVDNCKTTNSNIANDQQQLLFLTPKFSDTPKSHSNISSSQTPSLPDSLVGVFESDDIREILNIEKVTYRLADGHLQALAKVLNLEFDYLRNLLDNILKITSENLRKFNASTESMPIGLANSKIHFSNNNNYLLPNEKTDLATCHSKCLRSPSVLEGTPSPSPKRKYRLLKSQRQQK